METILYTPAVKFPNKAELRKVKEKTNMALLGQMLIEGGIEEGEVTELVPLVIKEMKRGLSSEETAELLRGSPDCVGRTYAAVQVNPGLDKDEIFELMKKRDKEKN